VPRRHNSVTAAAHGGLVWERTRGERSCARLGPRAKRSRSSSP